MSDTGEGAPRAVETSSSRVLVYLVAPQLPLVVLLAGLGAFWLWSGLRVEWVPPADELFYWAAAAGGPLGLLAVTWASPPVLRVAGAWLVTPQPAEYVPVDLLGVLRGATVLSVTVLLAVIALVGSGAAAIALLDCELRTCGTELLGRLSIVGLAVGAGLPIALLATRAIMRVVRLTTRASPAPRG